MDASLIISTRNRHESLTRTLASIEKLETTAAWELVIVDNGSTDRTAEVVQEFAAKTSLHLGSVTELNPGLANARNAGVRAASGEILIFTDDDCLPATDFIEQSLAVFAEDDSIGFSGGRILLHDPTDQPITIQEHDNREVFSPGDFIEAGMIQGANFAFRREALVSAGGFDPFFGAGSFYAVEDIDSIARVSALGWNGVYDPRPLVYHHHGRKTLEDVRQLENTYARGRGAYYAKCMLQKRWTSQAWKEWYWAFRRRHLMGVVKELAGGLSYVFRDLVDRNRRFKNISFENQHSDAS